MAKRLPSAPPAIAGYAPVRPLGTGGFADVFLYEQDMPRRSVAVKVLLSDVVDADVVRMFNTEADVMARLSSHPSILTVFQASVAPDGRPFIVMEYCPTAVSPGYRTHVMPVADVLSLSVRVASALESAHRAGVLHRDIKPSNIMFTAFGTPVLGDFGIATSLNGTRGSGVFAMSVPWSAPEVVREQTTGTVATEVWSLGATIFSLLAGHSPFELPGSGRNSSDDLRSRIVHGRMSAMDRDDVPSDLTEVLMRCMAKRPEDRWGSALDVAQALRRVEIRLGLPATPIEVTDAGWAAAGPRVDFDNQAVRGPVRAAVQRPSSRRRRGSRAGAASGEERPAAGAAPWWAWTLGAVVLVGVTAGVTLWLAG